MKRSLLEKSTVYLCGSLLFVIAFSSALFAQDKGPKGELLNVTTVRVKPESVPAFQEMVKKEFNPAIKKGGATQSSVWRLAIGNAFDFVFVAPLKNFAKMDGPGPLIKGLGQENVSAFFAKISTMVTDVNSAVIRTRPDLSYAPPLEGPPNVAVVVHVQVNPGKDAALEKFLSEHYIPVVKKAKVQGFLVSKIVFGGNGDEYTFLGLNKDFASLDKGPPINRVLKPEERAELFKKLPDGVIKNVVLEVARFQPDLSFAPAPEKEAAAEAN